MKAVQDVTQVKQRAPHVQAQSFDFLRCFSFTCQSTLFYDFPLFPASLLRQGRVDLCGFYSNK